MKKTTSYFEDDAYSKMEEMAKKEKRSFNQVLNLVVERGLNCDAPPSPSLEINESYLKIPADDLAKVKQFADAEERPIPQMSLMFFQRGLKEKERLREKYLKSLNK